MNADDKIREILRMEADAVEPSPAGWDAIQAGISTRRSRAWWTLGAALAGTAALVVGAVVYVATDDSTRGIEGRPVTSQPPIGESPTPSPSPSPSAVAAPPNEPIEAIWPLTTTDEVARWEADRTTYPSLATASSSVVAFARNYLGVPDPQVVALEGSFGENEFDVKREGVLVSKVTVRGFGADGTAPFVVTRAHSPELLISSPAAGSAVRGSVTATGSYEAVDPAFDVTLFADTGSTTPVELAKVRATTGPDGWSAPLTFSTKAKTGSLRVTNASLRDGGIGTAAAIPLVFGDATATGPEVMVAARDGRIAVISTANGEIVRWLTAAEPGGGAYDPALSDDGKTVIYVQASGTCSSEIRSVPVAGGTPKTLVGGGEGALRGPSERGDNLAYVRTLCQDGGSREEVVVRGGGPVFVEKVDGAVRGGVVAGDRFVVYVTVKGDVTTLHSVDAYGEFADVPQPAPEGCAWEAVTLGARDDGGREQMFAAAGCSPRDEVVESRLYRLDADGKGRVLLATLPSLYGVRSLDYASDTFLLIGTQAEESYVAYTYVGDTLRRVPGQALRPSWS